MIDLQHQIGLAVSHYWHTRLSQANKQAGTGKSDQGSRSAVTGGAQMDGFVNLTTELLLSIGVEESAIFTKKKNLELPGYFRATKEWDLLVVRDSKLIAAIEYKSQAGPSFGNNFNNRTEEAMGSALDLWTAFREGALSSTVRPWLGYFFLLEGCDGSYRPVRVNEPHFKVFPEFEGASYAKRYEIFCRKLVRERHYDSSAFMISESETGPSGQFSQPSSDLAFEIFAKSLVGHVNGSI